MTDALQKPAAEEIADAALFEAYFQAFASRDPQAFGAFLHDDVVWTISGPVDVIPYCGTHRGKAAVIDIMARQAPKVLRKVHLVRDKFLIDGNRGAALTRLTAQVTADGRTASYRVANFFRFEGRKLIENTSLLDSFDAAEQVLGFHIDV